jgi:hypothetical protein
VGADLSRRRGRLNDDAAASKNKHELFHDASSPSRNTTRDPGRDGHGPVRFRRKEPAPAVILMPAGNGEF